MYSWHAEHSAVINASAERVFDLLDDQTRLSAHMTKRSYAYQVDNQAMVIPKTIDAIRALAGRETSAHASIERTNHTLGGRQRFV